jgi:hypothetical protein
MLAQLTLAPLGSLKRRAEAGDLGLVGHAGRSNRVGFQRQPATHAGEHRTRVALRGRNAVPHLAQV